MKGRKKKIITFDELLEQTGPSQKSVYQEKYKKSIESARGKKTEAETIEKLNIRTGYYSLRTRILKNSWVGNRPASKATSWLFKTVFKDPKTYKYNRNLLYQSGLFIFEYKNPKFKGTSVLPWFDEHPLIISLGPVVTNQGVRNLGFNLHLLPPRIRLIVICAIFEMYKKLYRYQVFYKQDKPVQIHYKQIVKALERFGVKFCIRMYIPARMNKVVRFPIKEWHKAIFIPSRRYNSIKAAQLIKEWRAFNHKHGFRTNANSDWKSII